MNKSTKRAIPAGYVSRKETIRRLGVCTRTLTNMVQAGVIGTVRRHPKAKYSCGYSERDIESCLAGYQQAVANVWNSQPRA